MLIISTDFQELYKKALFFAASSHQGQYFPGTDLPYLVHVVNVANEIIAAAANTPGFDINFGVTVALLHDTLEDTDTTYEEINNNFGERVSKGVLALTKFKTLKKEIQMIDSLQRIQLAEKEVWAVKLADRITNLEAPPLEWSFEKRHRYFTGAENIYKHLSSGNSFLAKRLEEKIQDYRRYVITGEK